MLELIDYYEFIKKYVPFKERYDFITTEDGIHGSICGTYDKYANLVVYRNSSTYMVKRFTKELNNEDEFYLLEVYLYLNFE